MLNTILGTKAKMTQAFVDNNRVPVSVINAGPCVVTQVKTEATDGYFGVQLGMGTKRIKNITKPLQGHLKGAIHENKAPRFLREVRVYAEPTEKAGDVVKVSDIFTVGDTVSVTGVSKGKGFAGGMKRHGFAGGPKTHGQSDRHRAPGSIGQGTSPGRVWKGKRMAGRMGNETISVKNLHVVAVDPDQNELHLSGPVPGVPGSLLIIRRISEKQEPEVVEVAKEANES